MQAPGSTTHHDDAFASSSYTGAVFVPAFLYHRTPGGDENPSRATTRSTTPSPVQSAKPTTRVKARAVRQASWPPPTHECWSLPSAGRSTHGLEWVPRSAIGCGEGVVDEHWPAIGCRIRACNHGRASVSQARRGFGTPKSVRLRGGVAPTHKGTHLQSWPH